MGSGKEKQLSGTAALVMFATLLSRITGFLRNVLISSIMSPKGYSDEFWVAFSLPDLAFDLLIGGAIAAAIIPILASSLSKGEEREGWKAVGTFINVTVIAVIFVEILFFIRTPFFVSIVAKGYQEGTEQFRLTVKLTRILLPSAVFMILAGQSNGILNAYNKFAAASFGPVIYNMCVI
ncbi:MAG: murein biosynthesis integral membrane protein MurJ, partial [Clostridiaceae bacterium]|nr:murein biosynthesis integral membrane protein MurJ [Clostridiaceae bacterium]